MKYALTVQADNSNFQSVNTLIIEDDPWYDVCLDEPEEREILEETLPIFQEEVGDEIQDVCSSCWYKLLRKED